MSKAEERAKETYPLRDAEHVYDEERVIDARGYFVEGYHQAEKDLELTWEDISKIISIDQQVCGTMGISNYTYNHQQAMKEVLKRFKEMKK